MSQDLYDILGVSRDADDAELKKAYRRLARQYGEMGRPARELATRQRLAHALERYERDNVLARVDQWERVLALARELGRADDAAEALDKLRELAP